MQAFEDLWLALLPSFTPGILHAEDVAADTLIRLQLSYLHQKQGKKWLVVLTLEIHIHPCYFPLRSDSLEDMGHLNS